MKARTISSVVTLSCLLASAGSAFAYDNAHEAYDRVFVSDAATPSVNGMGMAGAMGDPSGSSLWSGHDAYERIFLGKSSTSQPTNTLGKAAFGSEASAVDGNAFYHQIYASD